MGYSHLSPQYTLLMLWNKMVCDLIRPWKIWYQNGEDYEFYVLTNIDPVTNLVKIIKINNKISQYVIEQFINN